MKRISRSLAGLAVVLPWTASAQEAAPVRPRAGKPPIMRASEVRAGMKGTAWTVFAGSEPEPVPVEILGLMKNAWGPRQDIILGKMTGKASRTNVAGGMSGSPVYVDGKLVGAVSLRLSVFSPDSICGITPIELMLEINDFDQTRPADARSPDRAAILPSIPVPGGVALEASAGAPALLTPIGTPLVFSGFHDNVISQFAPVFRQMGVTAVQGGAGSTLGSARPEPGWQTALQPGDAVSGILVSGDMSMSAMGTVTYNDGRRVLAFGHPFLSLGPVEMPMARSEVVLTLASAFQPNKIGNAAAVVGALKQDRHSGILGVLGEQAEMIPCKLKVRSFGAGDTIRKEKEFRFQVFVQQKWTPFLMMVTLFNGLNGLNDFADEATYRLSGNVEIEGSGRMSLQNMFAQTEAPFPVPIQLANWWGEKFNRLFVNSVRTPKLRSVDLTVDLLPERRTLSVDGAFAETSEVRAGEEVPVKVYLRPYRGGRIERRIAVRIPPGFPRGEHRILLSDADTLNRIQAAAGMSNRFIDLPQTVNLINQERTNTRLYVSLVQSRPTVLQDDKTLPNLPASVANVMQNGRSGNRPFAAFPETAEEQMALPFDQLVSGSHSLRVRVN